MAISFVGRWELEWNTPEKEIHLWSLMLRDFGIKDWYMWPIAEVRNTETQVNLLQDNSLSDILSRKELADQTRVFFEPYNPVQQPESGKDLRFFEHPEDAVYIFGSAHFNPVPGNKREQDFIVQVPTNQNKGVLWPHQCAAISLYDKLCKEMKSEKIHFPDSF